MEKISVLIPVYNGEKYIKNCLDSIISQTYKNLEIIVIDDGSTDNTVDIVKQYSNIKLYRNPRNMGLGFSRNVAIEKCETELFIFVDADDSITNDCIEILYQKMISTNADIVMGGCNFPPEQDIILEGDAKFDTLFNYSVDCFMTVWNKLYKKEIFNNIKFPDTSFAEDEHVLHLVLNNARKMIIIPNKTYIYYDNKNGLHTTTNQNHMIAVEAFYNRYIFFLGTKFEKIAYGTLKHYLFTVMEELVVSKNSIKHLRKYFFRTFKFKYVGCISLNNILFLIFPKLYMKLKVSSKRT